MGLGSDRPEGGVRDALRVVRVGKGKREIFVQKKGHKKLVIAYGAEYDEVFVITGSAG